MLSYFAMSSVASRNISTSTSVSQTIKLSRLRVVDNSEEDRLPRCIHMYNKQGIGYIDDRMLVAVRGEKKKQQVPKVPKFVSNNLVLVDDNDTLLGT
ncbi:39S ribosomal protein L14, mitochondrial [Trachymyrmex cornetzi]|uniref:39S ribosomal protein L14, mitochondrial n=1 Tax=Trachymyrmex cornetzi TaxID=471704 RepID=A0A151IRK5_9HYME|nr:39S ribosomal protein L14, mitochondrial [Trachymyrmex cornetzi]